MATLKDVAEEAGLAVSTVSRIMNNRGYISANARKRVDEAMKKLNYQPNELARSLQKKTTNTIGVIVPHIQHPYFAKVISNLEHQCYLHGYKMMLCNSQGLAEKEKECLEICMSMRVCGVIMCTGGMSLDKFRDLQVPLIAFERYMDAGDASIECDNILGGRLAAELLIKKGCKKLIHLGDIKGEVAMPADDRGIGFQEVCLRYGIDYFNVYTDKKAYKMMDYQEEIKKALLENPNVDGIFANSDIGAAQVLLVCRKLGIKVPEDIKVIGFDDVQISSLTAPQITTIHQPVKEMARIAVQMVEDTINGKMVPSRTILPVELIERESTGYDLNVDLA